MGSAHDHAHDTDTYYLDQLCMVGITGAFAGICLTLYAFQRDPETETGMLYTLLQKQFHPMILAAGVALLVVTLVRAAVLWKAAGKKNAAHAHDHVHQSHDHAHHDHHHGENCAHDHDHHVACGHDHHHHDHTHGIVQQPPSPALATLPLAPHDHGHDHGHGAHDDHDHGWAPWRYVVLLLPLMLYLLGLPSKAMPLTTPGTLDVSVGDAFHNQDRVVPVLVDNNQATVASLQPDMKVWGKLVADSKVQGNQGVAAIWATSSDGSPLVSAGDALPWTPLGVIKAVNSKENTLTVARSGGLEKTFDLEGTVYIDYKQLEQLAFDDNLRHEYDHKKVQVVGQFAPYPGDGKVFSLARLRIQCCGADAIQLNVPIFCREPVTTFKQGDWVRVTGRIEFREHPQMPGVYKTILIVNRRENVVATAAGSPYLN